MKNHAKFELIVQNTVLKKEISRLKKAEENRGIKPTATSLMCNPFYLEEIIARMPGNIFWQDKNGIMLGCNDQQAKCFGLSSRYEIIGKTPYDVLSKADADQLMQNNAYIIAKGKPHVVEESVVIDGKTRIFFSEKVPLKDNSGEIVGILGIASDITELKAAENEIAKIKGMGAIGSSIAHELRTPLGSIESAANALKRFFPTLLTAYLSAQQAGLDIEKIHPKHLESLLTLLDDIESEVHSANTIINMLLLNIKQLELKPEELEACSISECIDAAIRRYPFASESQAGLIYLDLKGDFKFQGKTLLMIHVLFNLIKNALYAIQSAGKGEVQIWIESGFEVNNLYFKDTAKGIPPDAFPKLFNRFFTTALDGTGLGLSFCKMVMQAFGGNIACESVEGEFTLFKLSFPAI